MLYTKAIDEITWDDVELFCKEGIEENAYLDYKREFPNNLYKTISAMGNVLGGIILIGVEEDDLNKPIIPIKGIKFEKGLSERVLNIILSNITPPLFPEIVVCKDKQKMNAVVVIRIHQSHQSPHAIAKNTKVYLRTGNVSTPEERANITEIKWLQDHRKKSINLREQIYSLAENRFLRESKYLKHDDPIWLKLSLCPLYPKQMFLNPPELRDIYDDIKVEDIHTKLEHFPLLNNMPKLVQDGTVLKYHIEGSYYFYTFLNCFGLYDFRQQLQKTLIPNIDPKLWRIEKSEVLHRLSSFINSAYKYYEYIHSWGLLKFKFYLGNIDNCILKKPPESVKYSSEEEIKYEDIILPKELLNKKENLILKIYQRVSWSFGIDCSQKEIDDFLNKSNGVQKFK